MQRVVDAIAEWGRKDGYFKSEQDGENFRMELGHLMLTQKGVLQFAGLVQRGRERRPRLWVGV